MERHTLMGEHMLSMRRRGLSDGTISRRRYPVMSWFKWCELHGVGVFEADAEHVEQFLDPVQRKPTARASMTSHLHMFYKWAPAPGADRARSDGGDRAATAW